MSDDFTPFALVADDDAIIRMDAADILADAGFRVHEAAGYDQAVAILKDAGESIQLLFTDVQMPPGEMNGFHLAQECSRLWPDIRILIASGVVMSPADGELPPNAVFVRKPFSADVVYERLQELLPDGQKPEPLRKRAASR
jgi:CheY-like chemotaxis protein